MSETNIEIRSEEVQEILGFIPHWIIRVGIGVIFTVLILLFIGSWFFKYPDIISSSISITTENPPAALVAKTSGNIDRLFVVDKQNVIKGQVIAIVENTANYKHIIELNRKLDSLQVFFLNYNTGLMNGFNPLYELGQLQGTYSTFLKLYFEYKNFIEMDYHNLKIQALQKQLEQNSFQLKGQRRQADLLKKELALVAKQFSRDSGLYVKKVIPASEYEKAEQIFIQKKYSWESSKTAVTNGEIQSTQLEQSILDLKLQKQDQQNQLQVQLKSAYDVLKSELDAWELTYLFKSPIDGKISFSKIWSPNQNIAVGEVAFTIVPKQESAIVGKLQLPIAGSGKVKEGQIVNIKFNSFPYMEYGTVQGQIESIALVPQQEFYMVAVSIPQNLETNYGRKLPFSQQMNGVADIITENISVIERLFNPLRAIFKKYQ